MNIYQNITIHHMRVDGVSNSSVLQIGTAGSVRALANLYNTGGFTEPAPLPAEQAAETPWVPFAPPT